MENSADGNTESESCCETQQCQSNVLSQQETDQPGNQDTSKPHDNIPDVPNIRSANSTDKEKKDEVLETSPHGRYVKYNEKLGVGQFKTVWRGVDTMEGDEVAWCSVSIHGIARSEWQRILNEMVLLQDLKHPKIISYKGSWMSKEKQEVVFITERLTSGTLKDFSRKMSVIRWRVVKRWLRSILEGLVYLHGRDPPVIHRDLKCDNIFINAHSSDQLRIGDFGLSTMLKPNPGDALMSVLGTPEFMAPELYEEKYNEKVDIYAFGMCCLEMITKARPYVECSNPAQIYKKVTSNKLPDVLSKGHIDNKEAVEFMKLCLDADPTARPSAEELLNHPFLKITELDENEIIIGKELERVDEAGEETDVENLEYPGNEGGVSLPMHSRPLENRSGMTPVEPPRTQPDSQYPRNVSSFNLSDTAGTSELTKQPTEQQSKQESDVHNGDAGNPQTRLTSAALETHTQRIEALDARVAASESSQLTDVAKIPQETQNASTAGIAPPPKEAPEVLPLPAPVAPKVAVTTAPPDFSMVVTEVLPEEQIVKLELELKLTHANTKDKVVVFTFDFELKKDTPDQVAKELQLVYSLDESCVQTLSDMMARRVEEARHTVLIKKNSAKCVKDAETAKASLGVPDNLITSERGSTLQGFDDCHMKEGHSGSEWSDWIKAGNQAPVEESCPQLHYEDDEQGDSTQEELRKIEAEHKKAVNRAKKAFSTRLDNLEKSQQEKKEQYEQLNRKFLKEIEEFTKKQEQLQSDHLKRLKEIEEEWAQTKAKILEKKRARRFTQQTNETTGETLQFQSSAQSTHEEYPKTKCSLCMDLDINTVFIPCGHRCCCANCADKCKNSQGRCCPLCRNTIDNVQRTYDP